MKAIILAAGSGKRMRPLSNREHKTLLRIGGKTIIARIVDGLIENGIDRIIVGTGYMAGRLKRYLTGKYPTVAFTFINNSRFGETNNIHTLALIFSAVEIDEDIILIESDLIYEPSVIRRIIRSDFANVALVDKFRSGMDGTVVGISENRIVDVFPPHLQSSRFDFTDKYKTLNIYKFSSEFCNSTFKKLLKYYSKVIDDNCYYELILGILIYIQRETIFAEKVAGERWAEVDDPNDLKVADFIFSPQKRLAHLKGSCGGFWNHDILDFCFIRNIHFPNSSIFSEIRNNLENLALNYGSRQSVLNQKFAYFLSCDPNRVHALNGASQIYPLLAFTYAREKVLIPDPTFGEYPRAFPDAETYPDRVGIDCRALEGQASEFDVIVIVNPNNPTGSVIPSDWIYRFSKTNSGKTIIVDESFIEFSNQPSLMEALEAEPLENVVIVKSLSKSWGIPGLRLGYIYTACSRLSRQIHRYIPIWNMNSIAEFFLEVIFKHRDVLDESFALTVKDRAVFRAVLAGCDFVDCVYPSQANFLLVKFHQNRSELERLAEEMMESDAIYVKDISERFGDGGFYLRLAVRSPEENRLLIASLEKHMKNRNLLWAVNDTAGESGGMVYGEGNESAK